MKDNQKIELQKIIDKAQSASLSMGEKASMRSDLVTIINKTPIVSPFLNFMHMTKYAYAGLAVLFLFLVGGGSSYFAKNSLPGDALYSMKINVNEKLESFLATTPETMAQVSAEQATRRVIEAEALAVNGGLTSEKNIELQNNFSKDIDSLNTSLSKLDEQGATSSADLVRVKLDSEIESHSGKLSNLFKKSSTSTEGQIFTFFRVKSREGRRGSEDGNMTVMSAASFTASVKTSKDNEDKSQTVKQSKNSGDNEGDENEKEGDDDDEDGNRGTVVNTTQVVVPALPPVNITTPPITVTSYTMAQVALHNKSTDCWSTISGGVYNLTTWIKQHPGGQSAILGLCGIDGTAAFLAQHGGQGNPAQELVSLKIGILK